MKETAEGLGVLLSVIIPSFNHQEYVLKTIQAARKIPVSNKEIIVIDDGSSDGSPCLIREYLEHNGADETIRMISRENRGLVKTLNDGLAASRGRYFYVVASDDIPIPEGIARLINILERHESLQFVLGNALFMHSEHQREFMPTHGEPHRRVFALPYEERQKVLFLRYPQPMLLQASVFRTTALKSMGGWREDIVVDDMSLFLRILERLRNPERDFAFRPEIMTCFYRQHQANSHLSVERQFTMIEQVLVRLCPREWRDAALFRNCAIHSIVAARQKKPMSAIRFARSTVGKMGVLPFIRTAPMEVGRALLGRICRRRAKRSAGPLIPHKSAADGAV